MTVLAYDEVWVREPRLMVPKMAPLSEKRINPAWANRLRFLVAPWAGVELLGSSLSVATGTVARTPQFSNMAYTFSSGALSLTPISKVSVSPPFTVIVHGYVSSVGAAYTLWSSGDNANTNIYYQAGINADGTIRAVSRNTTYYSSNSSNVVTANVPFVAGARYSSTTSREAILNGVVATPNTDASDTPPQTLSCIGSLARLGYGDYLPGGVFVAAGFSRALSDAEIKDICANPYQLIIPA